MTTHQIVDIYPLSPMQQGMLFHSLYAPDSGVYVEQVIYMLHGELNIEALQQSWQHVLERHTILRTAFVWEDVDEPLQMVYSDVDLPLEYLDWSDQLPQAQQECLDDLLAQERHAGIALDEAPLMRLHLIRLAPEQHQLIWTHHHLLLDGWSVPIVLYELLSIYKSVVQGSDPDLAPARPYRDYIAWLQQQDAARTEQFWRQMLQGVLAPATLNVDQQYFGEAEYKGCVQIVSEQATTRLNDLARQHQVTLSTLIYAAWAFVLSRYSGDEDIVFGATVAGRPADLAGVETMVGLFINTLPVRVRIDAETEVATWLREIHRMLLDIRQYEYTPLVQIQKWSEVPADLPLFESILVFESYPIDTEALDQAATLGVEEHESLSQTNYPLAVVASPSNELGLEIVYDTTRFDGAVIERMLSHMRLVLEQLPSLIQRPLADISLLSEAERHQVLVAWNTTVADYPRDVCLQHLVAAQAARTPDAIALISGADQLTYADLQQRANQLAHLLQQHGITPGQPVGLCAERSPLQLIALLGILVAGGAYVPLDPDLPAARLAFMLQDAQVPLVLTQAHLVERLPAHAGQTICVDTAWDAIAHQPATAPASPVTADHPCYLIYTSGSTGQPKGVWVAHRSVVNHNLAACAAFALTPADRVLQFATLTFDAAVEEIFPTWITGATLVLRPAGPIPTVDELHALVEQSRLSVLDLPTAYWHAWMAELARQPRPLPPSLRLVVVGGEAAATAHLHTWWQAGGATRAWHNTYGPTEATVIATSYRVGPGQPPPAVGTPIPIGRPLPNVRLYVLDAQQQPAPLGVAGELYIGGAGVAVGYHNRPEQTAERFVPDPFSDEPGARLYRTGDRVRYLPDGNLEFMGRVDTQVKLRGFRIELGEIEAVLRQHPAVHEAVVLVREDAPGEQRLVAYVVAEGEAAPGSEDLREHLGQTVPEYMVPSAFVTLDALPLTPSNKIDRKALPAPVAATPDAMTLPETVIEHTLAAIWQEVLGLDTVGIHDNFFELGGDSILSIQIVARATQAGLHLVPKDIFQAPTIAQQAALATTIARTAEQGTVTGDVPLTPIQHWFFAQQFAEPHHWNQALLLAVRTPLDEATLYAAVKHVVAHHDALRLRFTPTAQGWQQTNHGLDDTPLSVQFVDLSGLAEAEQQATIEELAAQAQTRLNLEQGPLFHVTYFNLGATTHGRVLFIAHHLVIDGVSWRILLEDLHTAYEQLQAGRGVQLPLKTTSFQQWARQLVAYAQTDTVRDELAYWLELGTGSVARLPLDTLPVNGRNGAHNENGQRHSISAERHRTAGISATEQCITLRLSAQETHTLLQQAPRVFNTGINDVLLTALGRALQCWTGGQAVLIDLEGHGREDIDPTINTSRTVGWFTSVFPVRLEYRSDMDIEKALHCTHEALQRMPQNGLGYGLLTYLSDDPAMRTQMQAMPAAEVSFNYLGQFDQSVSTASLWAPADENPGPSQSPHGQRTHILAIDGGVVNGCLTLDWKYSAQLHTAATIEWVMQHFEQSLQDIMKRCAASGRSTAALPEIVDPDLSSDDIDALMSELDEAN